MFKYRSLKIEGGDGTIPNTRRETKRILRQLAKSMGLDMRFVVRKKQSASYCNVTQSRATVCEGVGSNLFNRVWLIHTSLHEMAHWIQYNEGIFQEYYGRPYYEGWLHPERKEIRRLALRAERHCDLLARRMSLEIFGFTLQLGGSIYDTNLAKEFLKEHYSE